MPNMDGTGPRFACGRNGRRFGYIGTATGNGFGRGLGLCRFADTNSKESLIAAKAALLRRLNQIEMRLKEN